MTPLFSTAFMPPIAYMATLAKYPEAHIEAKETFPKQTYRNRLEIMTANGVKTLTVHAPTKYESTTRSVGISSTSAPWRPPTVPLLTISTTRMAWRTF